MRGPVQCPDCGEARAFAGYLTDGGNPSEEARLFICRECNVTEKVAIDDEGAFIFERLDAMIPAMNIRSDAIPGPA